MLSFVFMVIKNGLRGARGEPDEALMKLYQGGDVSAFEVLLQRYERKIFGFIFRHVQHRGKSK